jgi:hypothetical protein
VLALGSTWSIIIMEWRWLSLSDGRVEDCAGGTGEGAMLFRRVLGEFLGPVRWRLALVALRKVEFATLRRDGGRARRKRWDRGSCCVGGESWLMPMGAICDGGIQGARRCTRPRMCWGIRNDVARA